MRWQCIREDLVKDANDGRVVEHHCTRAAVHVPLGQRK